MYETKDLENSNSELNLLPIKTGLLCQSSKAKL